MSYMIGIVVGLIVAAAFGRYGFLIFEYATNTEPSNRLYKHAKRISTGAVILAAVGILFGLAVVAGAIACASAGGCGA